MGELLRGNIGEQPDNFARDRIPLVHIAEGGGKLPVRAPVLLDQKFRHPRIAFADPDRILQFFLIDPHALTSSFVNSLYTCHGQGGSFHSHGHLE
ncbi:hypothetical protein D3C73_1368800 [compost metagenome]